MTHKITRRRFTHLAGVGVLGAAIAPGCGDGSDVDGAPLRPPNLPDDVEVDEAALRDAVLAYFDVETLAPVVPIGRRLADHFDDPSMADAAVAAVIELIDPDTAADADADAEVIERLEARVRRDFIGDDTLRLDGYQCSTTELSLCLLAWTLDTQSA